MYTDKVPAVVLKKAANKGMLVDLTAAAVADASYVVLSRIKVSRLLFVVSTATVSSGNIVVAFKQYPTVGSSASAVTLGSLTIPTAIAAGKVYYKDISPAILNAGDELVCEVTTAAAGGGAAGAGFFAVECEFCPEYVSNQSDMVASA
ncbi:MAG TPA: hypothetical protein VMZ26_13425 [Pyrinomonadaceae bacterium]|nr:hypothetical protein [Pyrinomonadaceae bacterium]